MKRILILAVIMLFSGAAFSQSWIGLRLTGGYDYNFNKYYDYNVWTGFEHENMDFNTGLDVIMRMSKKVRFRIELRYDQMNYGQTSVDMSNEVSKSEMKLHCIDINPRFDIRVWTKKKIELFVSPGLRLQYAVDSEETSYKRSGEISRHRTYVNTDYNDALPGVLAGGVLKYNVNKHMGLTFSPDFYYSFKKLYDGSNSNLIGFRTNIGIEYFF